MRPIEIEFDLDYAEDLEQELNRRYAQLSDYRILARRLDARGASRGRRPRYYYRVQIILHGESFPALENKITKIKLPKNFRPPLIVGAGPAGLFCALRLAQFGVPCTILERGGAIQERMKKIARFWRQGILDPNDNVCFGEGGAGLFSDGKLITRIKSPHIQYVMDSLVSFGAPKETAYISDPHLGSNKIRGIIGKMTDYLKSSGVTFRYHTSAAKILLTGDQISGVQTQTGEVIQTDQLILATGHSAHDVYYHLHDLQIPMRAKDYSIGMRLEHPRRYMDQLQYGAFSEDERLGTARYRLSYHDHQEDFGVYSFCMCPGGHVLSTGTEVDGLVVNGMSNFSRHSPWSNSAIVATVKASEYQREMGDDLFAGLKFQRHIEQQAYFLSKQVGGNGQRIPAMRLKDFLQQERRALGTLPTSSCVGGAIKADITTLYPEFILRRLRDGTLEFERKLKGVISDQALCLAPETRTSSPLTVERDKITLMSTGVKGLYPAGEGGGHAGGITSAAVDGVRVADAILHYEK